MTKLCQILAVEKGVRNKTERRFTDLHRSAQQAEAFGGFEKTYLPVDEDGYRLPPESKRVQVKAGTVLADVADILTRLVDVTYAKDHTNTQILTDVVLDGQTLITAVPGHHLLFLEKTLDDVRTFVRKLPTLDPAVEWHWDENQGLFASDPVETLRTAKIEQPLVLAPATDRHPAQVQMVSKDVPAGTWTLVRYSGAIPVPRKQALLERIDKLQDAVKMALAAANQKEVSAGTISEPIFRYLFN